jgi:methyl-accepting chemotaxis protein
VVSVNNIETRLVIEMRTIVNDRMAALKTLTLMTDAEDMQPEMERVKERTKKYADAESKLSKMFAAEGGDAEKALLARVKEQENVGLPAIAKASEMWLANKPEDATRVLIKEIKPIQKKWMDALDELATMEDKLSEQAVDEAETAFANARLLMLSLGGLALLAGIVAAVAITRGLLRQLGGEPDYAATIAARIAAGDLEASILVQPGDTSSLIVEMKKMRDALVNIVGQVRVGTDTMATASAEIAAGNLDLSERTEQQASSLEKTASSMDELTSTVKQNADNASEANLLAASASEVARKGGSVVSEVVATMGSINESAKKIVDIISVIDGIAFQTNILALNAAVEAARAGEQGRGFAVVASEVRNLAQRSAAAAKEIKMLIGDSVEKVEVGSKLVEQAGTTMNEVVASVKRVTDIMSEITSASQEQRHGIEQVNTAIVEMDSVTQQNAALVEEAASAAQSLTDQASELAKVVSVFKLGTRFTQEGAAAHRPAVKAVARKPAASANRSVAVAAPAAPAAAKPKKLASASTSSGGDDWEEF